MKKIQDLARPMIVLAILTGGARLVLTLMGAPRAAVYAASLTAVQAIAALYLPWRVARSQLGCLHLWAANVLVFGVCQVLIIAGLSYTYATGTPTLYHETERLRSFLGYDPTPAQHVAMHLLNWGVIIPSLATWLIGVPLVYFLRRRRARGSSDRGDHVNNREVSNGRFDGNRTLFLLAAAICWTTPASAAEGLRGVTSDYARLRAAIVMSIDGTIYKSSELGASIHPVFNKGLPPGAIAEHRAFVDLLRKAGVRVLQVADLVQDAVENARRSGELEAWVRETYPHQYDTLKRELERIDGPALLQMNDEAFYRRGSDGNLDPLFLPIASMYWSRDFAVSTPRGILIGNGQSYGRSLENSLARLMFHHARALRDYPVVFDAAREGVLLDGGDVIVRDERTLLIGVGQRSSPEAAPLLARCLNMDVIAVQMPPADKPNGMSRQLLHLDSIFNLLAADSAVAVPFFLEQRFVAENPVARILAGLAGQTDAILSTRNSIRAGEDSKQLRQTVELMPEVGRLTRYEAGTGAATPLPMKLVDHARALGCSVVFAGGDQGSLSTDKYVVERAMYELRWQGVNVVQLGPRHVVAYEHNVHTNAALRRAGIKVWTFPGNLLAMRNGGPHCLALPLERHGR